MRPPSLVVPLGAVIAAVGISMPIVEVGVRVPGRPVPGLSNIIDSLPEKGFGASDAQRYFLLGVVVLAVAAWLLPRIMPRSNVVAVALAAAATVGTAVAVIRGWLIATEGLHESTIGDTSFLERSAVTVLEKLEAQGILVVDPASGLWVLSAGVAVLLLGVLMTLRSQRL